MGHITVDDGTREKLATGANGGTVELRDASGRVVGYFLRPDKMRVYEYGREALFAWAERELPPEKVEEILNDPRPWRTMEDVLRLVEGK